MIIDAHAHIFDRMRGRIGSGPIEPLARGKIRLGDGTVIPFLPPIAHEISFPAELLLEYMDQAGVDKAVLLQGPFYGDHNEFLQQAASRWPKRFIAAAYLDPWSAGALDEFTRLVDGSGFRIVKLELSEATGLAGLHPGLALDDPGIRWLWDEADRRRLVVTLDLGPVGGMAYQTQAVRRIIEDRADLRIVIAHLAQPPLRSPDDAEFIAMWQEQVLLARHPRVWLDLASLPHYAGEEEYPYPSACRAIRRAVELVGAEKLLWGTDVPGLLGKATYRQLLAYIRRHCDFLTAEQLAAILGGNAALAYGDAT